MSCRKVQRVAFYAAALGLAILYGSFVADVFQPNVSEDYKRTYVSHEFGVFPPGQAIGSAGKIDLNWGESVNFTRDTGRMFLSRFDWRKYDPIEPFMVGREGRIFVHLPSVQVKTSRVLTLTVDCHVSPGEGAFAIDVNGAAVAVSSCSDGESVVAKKVVLTPGEPKYTEIRVRRIGLSPSEQVKIALGLGSREISVKALRFSDG